jgi:copper homeostasis protein
MAGLLEVTVSHGEDVVGAQEGGADRLFLVAPAQDDIGLSPDVPTVAAILRSSSVPVRVCLRLNDSFTTTGGEFTRLIGLGEEFMALGAEGLAFGFLDPFLEIDTDTCTALARALPGVPWTFHRGFDAALDPGRAWRRVQTLPGLTSVHSGGSPLGLAHGYDALLSLAGAEPEVARLLTAAGGLTAEQVTWLARAGVAQFQVAEQVRPTGAAGAYVDADLVRSWRLLVASATERSRPA